MMNDLLDKYVMGAWWTQQFSTLQSEVVLRGRVYR